jgi:hypothetical protein
MADKKKNFTTATILGAVLATASPLLLYIHKGQEINLCA